MGNIFKKVAKAVADTAESVSKTVSPAADTAGSASATVSGVAGPTSGALKATTAATTGAAAALSDVSVLVFAACFRSWQQMNPTDHDDELLAVRQWRPPSLARPVGTRRNVPRSLGSALTCLVADAPAAAPCNRPLCSGIEFVHPTPALAPPVDASGANGPRRSPPAAHSPRLAPPTPPNGVSSGVPSRRRLPVT